MKKSYILSLGAGLNQIELIQNIRKMNYKVISVDLNSHAPGKELSDIFLNISSHDYIKIIEEIKKLKINLVAVLTRSTGNPVLSVSKIAEEFGLKALNSNIAEILIDKNLVIDKLNELNIPSPKKYTIEKKDEIKFPVFVKPSKTNISHAGMKKCLNFEELEVAYKNAMNYSETNQVNIEEYLLGYDFVSFDYVYENEIMHLITVGEISSGEPSFDGIGFYTCPPEIEKFISQTINKFFKIFSIKIGFIQTASKIDLENKASKIYECHAEIGGDLVNDTFIPHISKDYNVFEQTINLFLGNKPLLIKENIKPSIIYFLNKIKQYEINYHHELILNCIECKEYVIIDFKDFPTMFKYLREIKNISITNKRS